MIEKGSVLSPNRCVSFVLSRPNQRLIFREVHLLHCFHHPQGLFHQLLAFHDFILEFRTILELPRKLAFALNGIIDSLIGKGSGKRVDIGLNLLQAFPEVIRVEEGSCR